MNNRSILETVEFDPELTCSIRVGLEIMKCYKDDVDIDGANYQEVYTNFSGEDLESMSPESAEKLGKLGWIYVYDEGFDCLMHFV